MRRAPLLLAALLAAGPALAQSVAPLEPTPMPGLGATIRPALPPTLPPHTGAGDAAYAAYQRGNYLTAFREATRRVALDRDDAPAMTLLAELYNQGLGVKQDAGKAAEWYRLAAARGDAHAMATLGLMALDGRGVPKDAKAGRDWLEEAAKRGEGTAAYNLALILLGTGRNEDLERAAALLKMASDQEYAAAQHALGVLYLQGRGVAKDAGQAAQLFRRAADNGDLAGEVEFAILLFNGEGVPKDEARAARLFRHAAGRGNAIAQNRVARLYVAGRGVPKNLVEAAAWSLAAAAQGLKDPWLDQALGGLTPEERARAERLAADRADSGT
jgi:uncharacterized protein